MANQKEGARKMVGIQMTTRYYSYQGYFYGVGLSCCFPFDR